MARTSGPSYKYFAFISYSRRDSRAAKWLQRRLEWFRFPLTRVSEGARPPHRRYIRPVYRDKTNLDVTDEHYWENIKTAIDQSRFLIVLCSPNSAASRPVDMEVRHFLQDPDRPEPLPGVVPVVLSGNVASGDETECLCPALAERKGAITGRNLPSMVPDADDDEEEGWENGFIGAAAYLLKVKRESLRDHCQREARRRARRAGMLAVVFAVLTVAAVAGGIVAWHQRNRAERMAVAEREARKEAVHNLAVAHIDRARSASQSGDLLLAAQAAMQAFRTEDHPATWMAAWEYLLALPTEKPAFTTRGSHRGTLCLLPEGGVAVGGGKAIRIWDAAERSVASWPVSGGDVVGLADAGGGSLWVLTRTGRLLLAESGGGLREAAVLDSGASLAAAGGRLAAGTNAGAVYVFASDRMPLREPTRLDLPDSYANSVLVALSGDGKTVFASHCAPATEGGGVLAIQVDLPETLWHWEGSRPGRLCLASDGRLLAWYTMEGSIYVADVADGRLVQRLSTGGNLFGWIGFHPNSRELAYAFSPPSRSDGVVEVLDVAMGTTRRIYEATGQATTALFASANRLLCGGLSGGQWLEISSCRRHSLVDQIVWDIHLAEDHAWLLCAGRPNWLDVDGGELNQRRGVRTLRIGHEMWPFVRGTGAVVRMDSGLQARSLPLGGKITCSAVLPGGSTVTGNESGDLHLVDRDQTRLLRSLGKSLRFLHAGPGDLVAYGFREVGAGDGILRVTPTGQTNEVFTCDKDGNMLTAAAISESGLAYLARGAWWQTSVDGRILAIDCRTGKEVAHVELPACGAIRDVAFVSGQTALVAALASGDVAVLALPGLEPLRRIPLAQEPLYRLAELPGHEDLIAVGDGEGSVHLVDYRGGESLYRTTASGSPVTALAIDEAAWWVAFENRVERWRHVLDAGEVENYAKQVRWHSLTDLRQLAKAAEARGRLPEAIAQLERVADLQPRDTTALTEIVRLQRRSNRFADALATIDRIVATGQAQARDTGVDIDFSVYVIQKGLVLFDKWQHTADPDALRRAADVFLGALLRRPAETTIHTMLVRILLADGRSDAAARACRFVLDSLEEQEGGETRTLHRGCAEAGLICAVDTGAPTAYFEEQLRALGTDPAGTRQDGTLDVWLGERSEATIDCQGLADVEAARLHCLLALRHRSASRLAQAREHFRKGVARGDWRGYNQRGLDALAGKSVKPLLLPFHVAMYDLCLANREILVLTELDEQRRGLRQLVSRWESLVQSNPSQVLALRGLALVLQLTADVEEKVGGPATSLSHHRKCAEVWRDISRRGQQPSDIHACIVIHGNLSWRELLAGNFAEAMAAADHAVSLLSHDRPTPARMNLAHAYLLTSQFDKSRAIYARYAGTAFEDGRKWNDEVRNDFKLLREAGHDHAGMKRIEALLGAEAGEDEN